MNQAQAILAKVKAVNEEQGFTSTEISSDPDAVWSDGTVDEWKAMIAKHYPDIEFTSETDDGTPVIIATDPTDGEVGVYTVDSNEGYWYPPEGDTDDLINQQEEEEWQEEQWSKEENE